MRIGNGYDVHAFTDGDHLMIGGVRIPYEKAFLAHSDGDVLLHAISDALLGAASLGDIGRHFPDTDPQYKGADSRELLRQVVTQLMREGLRCVSVDATIIAQEPKMGPHVAAMCAVLSADLQLDVTRINVKATTTERLGFCGREEGIAAMASVLLEEDLPLTRQ
ncbi:MAG: 2-C-methyl-D-erythritol 2,4-cyclodiphosphate synthase [Granulosicoccus sp.]